METLNNSGFHRKKSWIYGLFFCESNLKSVFPYIAKMSVSMSKYELLLNDVFFRDRRAMKPIRELVPNYEKIFEICIDKSRKW